MSRPTDAERELNERELLESRFDRDQEREPGPRRRARARTCRAFEARVADIFTAAVRLPCPICRGPVYAPADSDRERLDCDACGAALVTRQGIDGVAVAELDVDEAATARIKATLAALGEST